jgi:polynucleotide 5'-kinase involved in rRNA processing
VLESRRAKARESKGYGPKVHLHAFVLSRRFVRALARAHFIASLFAAFAHVVRLDERCLLATLTPRSSRQVLVCGGTDVGKSTLCRILLSYAARMGR